MFVRAWVIPRVDAHTKIPALFIPMLYPLLWNMFNNVFFFFVCARIDNTTYITFIMWNSISAMAGCQFLKLKKEKKMSSFMFVHT